MTHHYFLKLAYNGKNYLGWQVQKQSPTVQDTVNKALGTIFNADINVVGCGRTDSGVHAREFYAGFELQDDLSVAERKIKLNKLNGFLPGDIVIYDILPVRPGSNARFDAISRTYKYQLSQQKDPFARDLSYIYFGNLDVDKMNHGANILLEYSDFTSFSKLHTQVKTNICIMNEAQWQHVNDMLIFTITADRFLRNMVRAIVGTLLDMGKGKIDESKLREIIESKDRSQAGYSVPAQGLFLHAVNYPENIFLP